MNTAVRDRVGNGLLFVAVLVGSLLILNMDLLHPGGLSSSLGAGSGDGNPSVLRYDLALDPAKVDIEFNSGTGYHEIRYEGLTAFAVHSLRGAPYLPAWQPTVLLPAGSRVTNATVLPSDRVLVSSDVRPEPIPGSDEESGEDPYFYNQDGETFPTDNSYILTNHAYRGYRLAKVAALPFEWDPSGGKLYAYRRVSLTIDLGVVSPTAGPPPRLRPERKLSRGQYETHWVREHVLNPEDLGYFYPGIQQTTFDQAVTDTTHGTGFHPTDRPSLEGPPIDMVIITGDKWATGDDVSDDMATSFQELADWRTNTGVPTVVRTLDWIRDNYEAVDDPARIRAFIAEAYSLWGTDFVTLGGDVEVVPARQLLGESFETDPITDWYYAALDYDPDEDNDGTHEFPHWSEAGSVDKYPELWVGRLPARNADEADAIIDKILTYERVPGLGLSVPPDSFYTKAIVAGGLTNSGEWSSWSNGIFAVEQAAIALPDSFSIERFYPDLGTEESCGNGAKLECYDDTKDYFIANFGQYPPDPGRKFTASQVLTALDDDRASVFFHMEHSNSHDLGGISVGSNRRPDIDDCLEETSCLQTAERCTLWADSCLLTYGANNDVEIHMTRELLATLSNGPSYFVGGSIGSNTGLYDRDSVDEVLLRDPDGGAVAFVGKVLSGNTAYNEFIPEFFDGAYTGRKPIGVAVGDAKLAEADDDPPNLSGVGALLSWTLFGDPSMMLWNSVPSDLTVTVDPDTMKYVQIAEIEATVKRGSDPVGNARVAIRDVKTGGIYAFTWTDTDGKAHFPSIIVSQLDSISVWAVADSSSPEQAWIIPPATIPQIPGPPFPTQVVYHHHEYSDAPDSGTVADVIEVGDEVDLTVTIKNIGQGTEGGGTARLAPTPRIKTALTIDGTYDPARVFIGRNGAHPPAAIDTFSLVINEYGIRPELEPANADSTRAFYIWRDEEFIYHLVAAYSGADSGDPFDGLFIAEGGIALVDTVIDATDSVAVLSSDVADTLRFWFLGDATNDSLLFDARAEDWVDMVDDTASYSQLNRLQTDEVDFTFRTTGAIPPSWRLTMTVAVDPYFWPRPTSFSDLLLDVASPIVEFDVQKIIAEEQLDPNCSCQQGDTLFVLMPRLLNLGDAEADSLRLQAWFDGTNVTVCQDTFWMSVDAGSEGWGDGFEFCDNGRTVQFDSLKITRTLHGVASDVLRIDDFDPWPLEGLPSLNISVDAVPTRGGIRANWTQPDTSLIDPIGYHVYWDTAAVGQSNYVRLTTERIPETRLFGAFEIDYADASGEALDHEVGVSAVSADYVESAIYWSSETRTNLQPRAGWPIKMPKGDVVSVVLVNMDNDTQTEIVAGGRVLAAWNPDGTPVIAESDGLLFDPAPDQQVSGTPQLTFWGNIAAANIDNDGEMEIVGSYGDDYLYVVDEDGEEDWSFKVESVSTPTIADLDGDGLDEVIVNSKDNGKLYVFESDSTPYRCNDELFGSQSESTKGWNWAGVAVAKLGGHPDTLEIIQSATTGYVYVWEAKRGCGTLAPLWKKAVSNPAGARRLSTPAIWQQSGVDTFVVVAAAGNYRQVIAMDASDSGAWTYEWVGAGTDSVELTDKNGSPVQVPALADFGDTGDLEIVIGRGTSQSADSLETKAALLYIDDDQNAWDDDEEILSTEGKVALPGRRGQDFPTTLGSAVIADFDNDDEIEFMIASSQGALFAWEINWISAADSFVFKPESGWPIVFAENPGTPAIADLDGDTFQELVVPAGDYVYVYDLPGLQVDVQWGTAGHDARRTGNVEGGGSGQPIAPPQEPETDELAGKPGLLPSGPNPVDMQTLFKFRVPSKSRVLLAVYDVGGRRVRKLRSGKLEAGVYEITWDGRSDKGRALPNGVYFARLLVGDLEQSRKIVIAK